MERSLNMKLWALLIASAGLAALVGMAKADDHLYQAITKGGLGKGPAAENTHVFTENSAGHSGDLAPGRGSPFTAFEQDDLGTPSVGVDRLTEKAQEHVPFGEEK
jgi:hypothetical protein